MPYFGRFESATLKYENAGNELEYETPAEYYAKHQAKTCHIRHEEFEFQPGNGSTIDLNTSIERSCQINEKLHYNR